MVNRTEHIFIYIYLSVSVCVCVFTCIYKYWNKNEDFNETITRFYLYVRVCVVRTKQPMYPFFFFFFEISHFFSFPCIYKYINIYILIDTYDRRSFLVRDTRSKWSYYFKIHFISFKKWEPDKVYRWSVLKLKASCFILLNIIFAE